MSQPPTPSPTSLAIGPHTVRPPVVLAPMAGITNAPFRTLCREFSGGKGLFVSEMITTRALVERNEKTMQLIHFDASETPRSIQLYGVDPATVGKAVRMIAEEDLADHIDLNFGCPVPKVTRKGGGSALPYKRPLLRAIAGLTGIDHGRISLHGRDDVIQSLLTGNIQANAVELDETLADLKLALTEACSNSVRHAYGDREGHVEISFELRDDRRCDLVEIGAHPLVALDLGGECREVLECPQRAFDRAPRRFPFGGRRPREGERDRRPGSGRPRRRRR